ncbi:MAG: hypothetical protein DDT31_01055 [Syntrophomonadaceae bacterium]|nr:hypothetical protein [Bacillota bacterium]
MFLPDNHPTIAKINGIDLIAAKGIESAVVYQYRSQVIAFINEAIRQAAESPEVVQDDMDILYKWFLLRNQAAWWMSAKKSHSPDKMAEWVIENALDDTNNLEIQSANQQIALNMVGQATPEQLEAARVVAESIELEGSPKQIKWARSIIQDNLNAIALSKSSLPTKASWWIDNRSEIKKALNDRA